MFKSKNRILYCLIMMILIVANTTTMVSALDLEYTVNEAIYASEYETVTVKGYIVGEPVSVNKTLDNGFRNNYAIAIADTRYETNTNNMIFVKLDGSMRERYGLKSNPKNINKAVEITGRLQTYYNNKGLKNVSSINFVSDSDLTPTRPEPTPIPTPNIPSTTSPVDSTGYYDTAKGKTGESLKRALNDIIDNHREFSYSECWQALRETDQDPSNPNNVILIYSGKSLSKYDNGGGIDNWNREHVWAKSHGDFGTSKGAGTDLHHLRPADVTVNSSRGNKNFDESDYPHREAIGCFSDSDSFEPRDEVKGDIARMIFYMATRYEGEHGEVDLEVVNYLNSTKAPTHGKLSTLLEWNRLDPVDDFERARNEKIYQNWQGNRNPFIDHPEWVEAIWN